MRRGALAVAAVAVALALPRPARAQSSQDKAAAEVLFEEGKELMKQKRYSAACPKFLESNRLDAGLGTILWLADCYEKNGQTASSWGQFREAADIALRQHDPREKIAHDRATRLEASLIRMSIVVGSSTAVPGMSVKRDGEEVGQALWGEDVPVDPGVHKIAVTAPRKKPWETTVTVRVGQRTVEVPVPPLEDAPEPVTPPPPLVARQTPSLDPDQDRGSGRGTAQRVVGGLILGVGAVGLGLGTYFAITAKSKLDDSNTMGCQPDNHCNPTGTDLRNTAINEATASTISFIAGGVVAATGLVIILVAPSGSSVNTKRENVSVAPWVGREGAGLGMRGAW